MKKLALVIMTTLISINLLASGFSGYITAKIDSFKCEINQNSNPELILKAKFTNNYNLMKVHNTFTSKLPSTEFCYDLSSFQNYFSSNNHEVQVWLQTSQTETFQTNKNTGLCGKYIYETIYIAVLDGIPRHRFTKSLPVYSQTSIFIENAPEEKCIRTPVDENPY